MFNIYMRSTCDDEEVTLSSRVEFNKAAVWNNGKKKGQQIILVL